MQSETNYLVFILIYVITGIISFFVFRWYENLEDELFKDKGYFGKYLVLRYGYYGSIPETRRMFREKEAKKRLRVYWLTMAPLGLVVGVFAFGTFPVYFILSLVFPPDS